MLLLGLSLASPASAGILVEAQVTANGSAPAHVRVENAGMTGGSPVATVFYDPTGLRWEVLVDADALDGQNLVLVRARATDRDGRERYRTSPDVLVKSGKEARVTIGGSATFAFQLVVTGEEEPAEEVVVHRSFFAEPGVATYSSWRMAPEWTALTCDEGPITHEPRAGSARFQVRGRYRPGERVEVRCEATTAEGAVPVRIAASFL